MDLKQLGRALSRNAAGVSLQGQGGIQPYSMSFWKRVKRKLQLDKDDGLEDETRVGRAARAVDRQPMLIKRREQMQQEFCSLGARVYEARSAGKHLLKDKAVRECIARIVKLEQEAVVLPQKKKKRAGKAAPKRAKKAAKKKAAKKKAGRSAPRRSKKAVKKRK